MGLNKIVEVCWHSLDQQSVFARLETNGDTGLEPAEVQKRQQHYGINALPEAPRRSIFSIFLHQFASPLIYLLLAAALIAFFVGEAKDALVILIVVLMNAIIGAFQEGRAEQSLEALRKLSKLQARVLRNGTELSVEASDLVPGDILFISAGDAVPADARLINASALACAEAALTGESLPTVKSIGHLAESTILADRINMIYGGTYVTAGRGIAVVVATGIESEIGKIATLATVTAQPKTELELRIQEFGRQLMLASIFIFILVVLVGYWRGVPLAEIFMIAVSQMVSLVPEGLPVAMTIALAVGVQRMASKRAVVRRLSAVESLGSTTVICTDKTGTLTRNEMTVTSIFLAGDERHLSVTGVGYKPEGLILEKGKSVNLESDVSLIKLLEIGSLCNDAQLVGPNETDSRWRILGDPTEGALLTLAAKAGTDITDLRQRWPRIAELPFSSETKMMATQHSFGQTNVVALKGAPESLLSFCSYVSTSAGIVSLEENLKRKVQAMANQMAEASLRVLALGFIEDAYIDGSKSFSHFSGKVILVGLIGELDPPREEVAQAVSECQFAGVQPVMVTGDHKATAVAIAKELGFLREGDLAVDGQELERLSDEDLLEQIPHIRVFARVHPEQKLRIVKAYQERGEVVAMTGDGVNDAPALVRANVGVAMGVTGTEVAKEAAKIVVADDNFATIVSAIAEGRLVYQNIRKLILFLIVTSIDEVVVLFLALVAGYPPPFAAVQILWINLVTEGTLTVNLIMEPAEGDEMRRPPVSRRQPLLDGALLRRLPLMVLTSVLATFGWFLYRQSTGASQLEVQTESFTVLALCQWFNVLNCRSETRSAISRDVMKNPWLLGGLSLAIGLHLAVLNWETLGRFFHTTPIPVQRFIELVVVSSIVLWSEELRKLIGRWKKEHSIKVH